MIGGIEATATDHDGKRLSALLWGQPGCGKTMLAGTFPGKKLWIQFDPNGVDSLPSTVDFVAFDFSAYSPLKLGNFKAGGSVERELLKYVKEHNIGTIVWDSMTTFQLMTLQYAVQSGKANVGNFVSSIEAPGMSGYGVRTAMSIDAAVMLQKVAASTGCHFVIITHELEKTDDKGKVTDVTTAIAGGAANAIPLRISEIWRVVDTGKNERHIYTRNSGIYAPMRTRMFKRDDTAARFVWKYDADKPATHEGHRVSDWFDAWKANGFDKIAMPK